MYHQRQRLAAALVALPAWLWGSGLLAQGPATQQQPRSTPAPGVLLLENGELLSGQIEAQPDHFVVHLPGGRLRIAATDVDAACDNVDGAYRVQRSRLRDDDVAGHLRLGRWCLRHGLRGYAARELTAALAQAPEHSGAAQLSRQLALADPPGVDQVAAPAGNTLARPAAPRAAPRAARGVEPVTALSPVAAESPPEVAFQGLSSASIETFVHAVQPLLLKSCATGSCHGAATGRAPRLVRAPRGRPTSRKLTQRNLQALVEYVDRKSPASSRLLTAVAGPHGRAGLVPLEEQQFQLLSAWVQSVSTPAPAAHRVSATSNPWWHRLQPPASAAPPSASRGNPTEPNAAPAELDPFDPEVFNRAEDLP